MSSYYNNAAKIAPKKTESFSLPKKAETTSAPPPWVGRPIKENEESAKVIESTGAAPPKKEEPNSQEIPPTKPPILPPSIARPSLPAANFVKPITTDSPNPRPMSLKPPLPASKPTPAANASPSPTAKIPPPLPASKPAAKSASPPAERIENEESSPALVVEQPVKPKVPPPLPGRTISPNQQKPAKPPLPAGRPTKKEEEAQPEEKQEESSPSQEAQPEEKQEEAQPQPEEEQSKPIIEKPAKPPRPATKPPLPTSGRPAKPPLPAGRPSKAEEQESEAQKENVEEHPEPSNEEQPQPEEAESAPTQETPDTHQPEISIETTESAETVESQEHEEAEKPTLPARASVSGKKPAKKGGKKTFSKILLSDTQVSETRTAALSDLKNEIQVTTPSSAPSSITSHDDLFAEENASSAAGVKVSDIVTGKGGKGFLTIIKPSENYPKAKTTETPKPQKGAFKFTGGVKVLHGKSQSELPKQGATDSPSNSKKLAKAVAKGDDPNNESSNIVSDEQLEVLKEYVKEEIKIAGEEQKWELKYRISRDKKGAKEFHAKCDNLNVPTIIIIESINGSIFGGFTTKNWTSPFKSTSVADKNAFIFSIYNKMDEERDPIKCPCLKAETALFQSRMNGPSFGADLVLNMQLDGLCDMNDSYNAGVDKNSDDARKWLCGSEELEVHKMEVFAITKSS